MPEMSRSYDNPQMSSLFNEDLSSPTMKQFDGVDLGYSKLELDVDPSSYDYQLQPSNSDFSTMSYNTYKETYQQPIEQLDNMDPHIGPATSGSSNEGMTPLAEYTQGAPNQNFYNSALYQRTPPGVLNPGTRVDLESSSMNALQRHSISSPLWNTQQIPMNAAPMHPAHQRDFKNGGANQNTLIQQSGTRRLPLASKNPSGKAMGHEMEPSNEDAVTIKQEPLFSRDTRPSLHATGTLAGTSEVPGSGLTGVNGGYSVKKEKPRVKSAHNVIEQRYRNKINDKFTALQNSVPTLRVLAKRKGRSRCDDEDEDDDEEDVLTNLGDIDEDLEGLEPAKKLNKGTILTKSVEYIKFLEQKNDQMKMEHNLLVERAQMLGIVLTDDLMTYDVMNPSDSQEY